MAADTPPLFRHDYAAAYDDEVIHTTSRLYTMPVFITTRHFHATIHADFSPCYFDSLLMPLIFFATCYPLYDVTLDRRLYIDYRHIIFAIILIDVSPFRSPLSVYIHTICFAIRCCYAIFRCLRLLIWHVFFRYVIDADASAFAMPLIFIAG